jgi:hypothetical protein
VTLYARDGTRLWFDKQIWQTNLRIIWFATNATTNYVPRQCDIQLGHAWMLLTAFARIRLIGHDLIWIILIMQLLLCESCDELPDRVDDDKRMYCCCNGSAMIAAVANAMTMLMMIVMKWLFSVELLSPVDRTVPCHKSHPCVSHTWPRSPCHKHTISQRDGITEPG